MPGREIPNPKIGRRRGQHERRLAEADSPRDLLHRGVGQSFCIQHNAGGIAFARLGRKRFVMVDLESHGPLAPPVSCLTLDSRLSTTPRLSTQLSTLNLPITTRGQFLQEFLATSAACCWPATQSHSALGTPHSSLLPDSQPSTLIPATFTRPHGSNSPITATEAFVPLKASAVFSHSAAWFQFSISTQQLTFSVRRVSVKAT